MSKTTTIARMRRNGNPVRAKPDGEEALDTPPLAPMTAAEPTPVGYYDNFRWPSEFHAVPATFSIREENTRSYWRQRDQKLGHQRERRKRKGR